MKLLGVPLGVVLSHLLGEIFRAVLVDLVNLGQFFPRPLENFQSISVKFSRL